MMYIWLKMTTLLLLVTYTKQYQDSVFIFVNITRGILKINGLDAQIYWTQPGLILISIHIDSAS